MDLPAELFGARWEQSRAPHVSRCLRMPTGAHSGSSPSNSILAPPDFILQLSARSGAVRYWDKAAMETIQISGRGTASSISTATMPQAQPQPTPYHSSALNLGQAPPKKGCNFGLLLNGTLDAYTGSAKACFEGTGLTCLSPTPLGQGAHSRA